MIVHNLVNGIGAVAHLRSTALHCGHERILRSTTLHCGRERHHEEDDDDDDDVDLHDMTKTKLTATLMIIDGNKTRCSQYVRGVELGMMNSME